MEKSISEEVINKEAVLSLMEANEVVFTMLKEWLQENN